MSLAGAADCKGMHFRVPRLSIDAQHCREHIHCLWTREDVLLASLALLRHLIQRHRPCIHGMSHAGLVVGTLDHCSVTLI